jgi:hypothetical protein
MPRPSLGSSATKGLGGGGGVGADVVDGGEGADTSGGKCCELSLARRFELVSYTLSFEC